MDAAEIVRRFNAWEPKKLLPCPFCGGRPRLATYRTSEDSVGARVRCDCGAEGPETEDAYADTINAAELWNRRVRP